MPSSNRLELQRHGPDAELGPVLERQCARAVNATSASSSAAPAEEPAAKRACKEPDQEELRQQLEAEPDEVLVTDDSDILHKLGLHVKRCENNEEIVWLVGKGRSKEVVLNKLTKSERAEFD